MMIMSGKLDQLSKLQQLEEAWRESFPRHAQGGKAAISGFHYQFLFVIEKLVRSWIDRIAEPAPKPTIFTETLSDILETTDGPVVYVTQVKRSRTSKTIQSALEELWKIYCVANESTPDLLPLLRFRILSAFEMLQDAERSIQNWRPSAATPTEQQLVEFRSIVSVDLSPEAPHVAKRFFCATRCVVSKNNGCLHRLDQWQPRLRRGGRAPADFLFR